MTSRRRSLHYRRGYHCSVAIIEFPRQPLATNPHPLSASAIREHRRFHVETLRDPDLPHSAGNNAISRPQKPRRTSLRKRSHLSPGKGEEGEEGGGEGGLGLISCAESPGLSKCPFASCHPAAFPPTNRQSHVIPILKTNRESAPFYVDTRVRVCVYVCVCVCMHTDTSLSVSDKAESRTSPALALPD